MNEKGPAVFQTAGPFGYIGRAALCHSQLGLLLLCWWYIAVIAISCKLPGTIGLPFPEGHGFSIHIEWLSPCLGSHCCCEGTTSKSPVTVYLKLLAIVVHLDCEVIEEGFRTCP